MPLKVAAKVDNVDREYFEEQIQPMMKAAKVDYIGEINDAQKSEFLSGAMVLLVPIDWPEPFGLGDDRGHGLRHAGHRLQSRARCRK